MNQALYAHMNNKRKKNKGILPIKKKKRITPNGLMSLYAVSFSGNI
jgi:hypothetical protein